MVLFGSLESVRSSFMKQLYLLNQFVDNLNHVTFVLKLCYESESKLFRYTDIFVNIKGSLGLRQTFSLQ